VAWGIGGKADLADLIDKLGPIISGGSVEFAQLVVDLIPMIQNFNTDLVPNVDVVAIDMVEDVLDIDGDGDTTDYVPDYYNFPRQNMAPKVKIDQTMTFNAPALEVGTYDSVILIGGIIVRGAGFVPMGIGVGVDSIDETDPSDGIIDDPIVLKVASIAGRIPEDQIRRVVLALALNMNAGSGDPEYHAGQIILVNDFSGTYSLAQFMLPPQLDYDAAARNLNVSSPPANADMFQALFSEDNRAGWHVYSADSTSFSLPTAPPPGDRSAHAGLIAMDLRAGTSYQDIPAFNSTNLDSLAELVEAFVYVGDGYTSNCANCSTGETGGFIVLWLVLGLALLRRRR
jgi:MYXO-CTERM domain-containing protein